MCSLMVGEIYYGFWFQISGFRLLDCWIVRLLDIIDLSTLVLQLKFQKRQHISEVIYCLIS